MMEKICIVEDTNNHNNTIAIPSTSSVSSIVKMIDSISIDLRKSMDKKVSEDCHHWSIREYCSDMRNKNVRKCAPFASDDDDEEKLREQLAPLHVPKFRWWQCQSCVQDIVVTTASEGRQTSEKASTSCARENHDALMGLAAVCGQENGVDDVSNQQIGDQTLSLPGPVTELHKNGTAGEEDTARELDIVCVPERGAASAGVAVVPEPADNVAASDILPFESRENNNEEVVAEVRAIDTSSRDMDVEGSASDKDAGAERRPSTELQECDNGLRRSRQAPSGDSHRTKHQGSTSSCRRRKRKVRLLVDIYADCERRRDPPASCSAVPEELAAPASTSAPRKRKMTKEPPREVKLPSRKTKKVRASKGDAKTTIATIHISGSESEEDDASAGTGLRSHMTQQQTGNGTSSAQLDARLSVGADRQLGGSSKEDIGLELSLNSYVVTRQQEGSLDLNKNLDLSLGSSKKAAEAETVREQRHEEDATMEIVELMAKHQYERSLPDAERNPCLVERIDDRDDEMTRLFSVYGSRVGPLQKEHNQGNDRVCGASNFMPLRHNFPQDVASQTATYLPPSEQPGKTVRDLDLNRADPDDSDLGVLLECPFAANNTGRDLNRREMESVQSLPNEAIPALQLLSLMDAGTQSRAPFSINVKKVLEKPFYPCSSHPSLTVDDRARLFGKPLYPPSHQVKEYSGPAMCGSSGSMRHVPAAYYGPSIVTSQQPEIAMRTYLPQQNQDWRSVRPVGTSGFPRAIRHCNPYQDKQKGLLGASPDAVFPLQCTALNFTENQKDKGSSHMYVAARPLRDMSEEKVCGENKNPAEFSIVEAGNVYTINGGDLKFSDDFPGSMFGGFNRQRFGITRLTADKGKGVLWGPAVFP